MDLMDCVVGFMDRLIVAVAVVSGGAVVYTMAKQNQADMTTLSLSLIMFLSAPFVARMFN